MSLMCCLHSQPRAAETALRNKETRLDVALWLELDIPVPAHGKVALTAIATAPGANDKHAWNPASSSACNTLVAARQPVPSQNCRQTSLHATLTTFLLPMDIITPA